MAFYRGQQGSVKFDDAGSSPAAIASTTAWSLPLEKETLDTTALGATARSNVGGLISGSGSCELLYTATSGDETNVFIEHVNTANDAGAAAFELYLDGTKKITLTVSLPVRIILLLRVKSKRLMLVLLLTALLLSLSNYGFLSRTTRNSLFRQRFLRRQI